MPRYQQLGCTIAIAGDLLNVVVRGQSRPITLPELVVLRFLHGENAINDIFQVGHTENRKPVEEKNRLIEVYGAVVDQLFPGYQINLPVEDRGFRVRKGNRATETPAAGPDEPEAMSTLDEDEADARHDAQHEDNPFDPIDPTEDAADGLPARDPSEDPRDLVDPVVAGPKRRK